MTAVSDMACGPKRRIGRVVKSNSHCDYVVQVDDATDVRAAPTPEDFGFSQFVALENDQRHWAVGLVYNSQLFNPLFLNSGPRLSSEPDPLFTPDLIQETRTLLGVILVGTMVSTAQGNYGVHGIPRVVVPVNTPVCQMSAEAIYQFHQGSDGRCQFRYYPHLLRSGGLFANQLAYQVLSDLVNSDRFADADRRALAILCKELAWKNTIATMG